MAANLAAVIAQTGLRVLLVDADLRRPSVHTLFGWSNDRGLADILENRSANWLELVEASPFDNLYILTSGPQPGNPAELLDSERFREILQEMAQHFDLTILDTPPVLPVTDAAILASIVDGVLLVIDVDNTRAGMLRQGREQLEGDNIHLVGAVMNKVSPGSSGYPHYYEYYSEKPKSGNGRASKNGRNKAAKDKAKESEDIQV